MFKQVRLSSEDVVLDFLATQSKLSFVGKISNQHYYGQFGLNKDSIVYILFLCKLSFVVQRFSRPK